MSGIITNKDFVGNSIGASRTIQEILNIQGGNTKYGTMASLISNNIVTIDELAQYFAGQIGALTAAGMYKDQYQKKDLEAINIISRNLRSQKKSGNKEITRAIASGLSSFALESAIKLGARGLAIYLQNKENFETYSQVYHLLYTYVYENPSSQDSVSNIKKAAYELKKIRKGFNFSDKEQRKIKEIVSKGDRSLYDLELPIVDNCDATMKENIAFLLSILHFQKFGDDERNDPLLLDYYDFLGFHGNYAKELAREQKNNYSYIANEQNAYLNIAKGMIKQLDMGLPNFNIHDLTERSREMAKFDPYKFKSKKKSGTVSNHQKTIADIYYKRPDFILNAAATVVAQFSLNDLAREFIDEKLKHWGIGDTDRDTIFVQGEKIKEQSTTETSTDEENNSSENE